jgi:hypothetical protein
MTAQTKTQQLLNPNRRDEWGERDSTWCGNSRGRPRGGTKAHGCPKACCSNRDRPSGRRCPCTFFQPRGSERKREMHQQCILDRAGSGDTWSNRIGGGCGRSARAHRRARNSFAHPKQLSASTGCPSQEMQLSHQRLSLFSGPQPRCCRLVPSGRRPNQRSTWREAQGQKRHRGRGARHGAAQASRHPASTTQVPRCFPS